MKEQNIDNLTSLWLLAAAPFGGYRKEGAFHVIELEFSAWPNRVWQDGDHAGGVKEILAQSTTMLTFSTWDEVENKEKLHLKSTQIGMSLRLQAYQEKPADKEIVLDKVDSSNKAILWSEVFQQCFGYSISHKIVEAIKDTVDYYLVRYNQDTVGCVAVFIKDNQIGIHSLGVLNIYRKQGFAEAVMHYLLRDAKREGLINAHLQASMAGLGIYRQIGFEEIFKVCNYEL